jgi:PAS domain S-box-containing protein
MKDKNSRALDLLLLMINLSQFSSKEKIIRVFTEALEEIWQDIKVVYVSDIEGPNNCCVEVSSGNANFGYLKIERLYEYENADQDLLSNAASILAIILNNNEQNRLLANDKLHLQLLIDEHIKAIRESEEKFRAVFERSVIGKSITSINGGIKINDAFCKMVGYSEAEINGKRWQELTHPDDLERDVEIFHSILRGEKESARWEKRFIHKNGNIVWADISSILQKDANSNPQYFITSIQDITDRKNAEAALKESENKFRSIFENNASAISIINTDTTISMVNDAYCQISGYTKDEVVGMSWTAQIPPGDLERLQAYNRKRLKNPAAAPDKYEFTFYKKNGELRHALMSVSMMMGNRQIVCSFTDITERRKAEQEVHHLNAELERRVMERTAELESSVKELEAFTYSVSHDLRSPLRHISGYIDLLNNKFSELLPDAGKRYLEIVSDSTRQMGALIDDLLQFSRTGRQEMFHSDLDMNELLQEAKKSLDHEIPGRNIEWIMSPLPHVVGDRNLLRLVWINLLSNAVKFTRLKKKAKIETGYREENSEYLFFVRDNGAGFDMNYVHKLFGVFQRLHPYDEYEGTGIGLANVQRIISKHKGRIWAEAKVNKGATFYFTLPKP